MKTAQTEPKQPSLGKKRKTKRFMHDESTSCIVIYIHITYIPLSAEAGGWHIRDRRLWQSKSPFLFLSTNSWPQNLDTQLSRHFRYPFVAAIKTCTIHTFLIPIQTPFVRDR